MSSAAQSDSDDVAQDTGATDAGASDATTATATAAPAGLPQRRRGGRGREGPAEADAAAASPSAILAVTAPQGPDVSPDLPLAQWPAYILTHVPRDAARGGGALPRGFGGLTRALCPRRPTPPWLLALAVRRGAAPWVHALEPVLAGGGGSQWLAIVTDTGVLWRREGAPDTEVRLAARGGCGGGSHFAWGPAGAGFGVAALGGRVAVVRPPGRGPAAGADARAPCEGADGAQLLPAGVCGGVPVVGVGCRLARCAAAGGGDECVEVVLLTADGLLRRVHVRGGAGGAVDVHAPGGGAAAVDAGAGADAGAPGALSLAAHHGHVTAMGLDASRSRLLVAGVEGVACCAGPGAARRGGGCVGACGGVAPRASISVWNLIDRAPCVARARARMRVLCCARRRARAALPCADKLAQAPQLARSLTLIRAHNPLAQVLGTRARHARPRCRHGTGCRQRQRPRAPWARVHCCRPPRVPAVLAGARRRPLRSGLRESCRLHAVVRAWRRWWWRRRAQRAV